MKKTARRYRWHVQLLCLAGLLAMLIVRVTFAQDAGQKALDAIPEPLRPQLVEQLALYVEYQRTKQYDKLYDLFSRSTIQTVFSNQTKEEFVRAYQSGDAEGTSVRLIEFTPTASQKTQEDSSDLYVIYGKAKMCQKGEEIRKPRVAVTAQLQEGKWYFSTVADVLVD